MNGELRRATIDGDVVGVERILAGGLGVDARDRYGQTALMLAAHHGHLRLAQTLIARGADLDATAKFGLTATMLAVLAGHRGVAAALVAAGADLRIRGTGAPGFDGKTAADLADAHGMPWPPGGD